MTTDEFKNKAILIHGDKYDYSKTTYLNERTKLTISCKKHGNFSQLPKGHLRGFGCPICSNVVTTTQGFIEHSNEIHSNKYGYSKTVFIDSRTNVIIICKEHGDFVQKPRVHLSGCGCQKCGINKSESIRKKAIEKRKITFDKFINRANDKHNNKYKYYTTDIKNINQKIKINCSIHGDFNQKINDHLNNGSGCPKCYNERRGNSTRKTNSQFIKEAKKVHKNKYNYEKTIYQSAHKKIIIVCPIHGLFFQTPSRHLRGDGCPKCCFKNVSSEQFINKANKVHKNKYNYSLVNYTNNINKVIIICPIHGEFKQSPAAHLNNQGCAKCGKQKGIDKKRITFNSFKIRGTKIHNNKYTYTEKYINSHKDKVEINCPIHGNFVQNVMSHLQGAGCPFCKASKGELKIKEYFDKNKINFIKQKTFQNCKNIKVLPFDFYLPDYNVCIEFDGIQHFKIIDCWGGEKNLLETKNRDSIKTEYCKQNNIPLLRIKYNEKIEEKLENFLKEHKVI